MKRSGVLKFKSPALQEQTRLGPLKLTPRQQRQSVAVEDPSDYPNDYSPHVEDGLASAESSPSSQGVAIQIGGTVSWGVRDLGNSEETDSVAKSNESDDRLMPEGIVRNPSSNIKTDAKHPTKRLTRSRKSEGRAVVRVKNKEDAAAVITQLRRALSSKEQSTNAELSLDDFNRIIIGFASKRDMKGGESARFESSESNSDDARESSGEICSPITTQSTLEKGKIDKASENTFQDDADFYAELAEIAKKQAVEKVLKNKSSKGVRPVMAAKLVHQGNVMPDSDDEQNLQFIEQASVKTPQHKQTHCFSQVIEPKTIDLSDEVMDKARDREESKCQYDDHGDNRDEKPFAQDLNKLCPAAKQRMPSKSTLATTRRARDQPKAITKGTASPMRERRPKMPYTSSLLVKTRKKKNEKSCTF